METYLDLGMLPMANNLKDTKESAENAERFPLQVMLCKDCGLSQLSVIVDPEELFNYYTYRSGVNKGYIQHCSDMAKSLTKRFKLDEKTFHIDIGGNDSTLLQEFKNILHHEVLNVDPSVNLTEISRENGIPAITAFWGLTTVADIGKRANLLTSTNVFAHLDDVAEFIVASKGMLRTNSILVIENPYLIDFIDNMEYDTIYFEHVSYWSVLPMLALCKEYGMKLISAEKQAIHGGSMRYIITRKESIYRQSIKIKQFCEEEKKRGFANFKTYKDWAKKVEKSIMDFNSKIRELKRQDERIIAFAASAKGNTLLNCAKIDSSIIDCIIDETPEKIGKFSPGTGIPIVGLENIMKIVPDYILILSWNFEKEIVEKVRGLGYKGKFITPIPSWKVI
jgi:hypothetical protein